MTNQLKDSMKAAEARLARRNAAERRFKMIGIMALCFAVACVFLLFTTIVSKGITGFTQHYMMITVNFDSERLNADVTAIGRNDFRQIIRETLREKFPEVTSRRDRRELGQILSGGTVDQLLEFVRENPSVIGTTQDVWVKASSTVDQLMKGVFDRNRPESDRPISDKEIAWVDRFIADDRIEERFNWDFFTSGDSTSPELAGIRGALMGSFYTMIVTMLLSFPLGVMAAVYLEEFAPKNKFTELVEVNINNLAAVPSIVFGLLGLAIFLNLFGLGRSAPLVGGLVLTLMTLPTIIIASRAAIKSVPPSIKEAAVGLGASPMQAVFHHTLPLAMPGILTGTIIGMAQALGETAPLLMIGMVAFIVDIPQGVLDSATVLPVQIYLWSDTPDRGFVEKTSAAIMVLLGFLIFMNALAVMLRKRLERKW